jgi:predicted branched-subunit amino acid permease
VGLAATGSGLVAIVLTELGLSFRHVLYGLSLATWLPRATQPPTPLLAATIFDEGFGVATREAASVRGNAAFLGANGLLYLTWVVATLPASETIGLDVIFPLSFLALLLPLIRTRRDAAVAVVAGGGAVLLGGVVGAGPAVVVAIAGAATIGAVLDRGAHAPCPSPRGNRANSRRAWPPPSAPARSPYVSASCGPRCWSG